MGYDRTTVARGRGQIVMSGVTLLSEDAIKVDLVSVPVPVNAANAGEVDRLDRDRFIEVSFTPIGQINAANLALLYPILSKSYGASLLGSDDVPLDIYFEAGSKKITIHNAAVTQQPALDLRVGVNPFGPVKFTGIIRKGYSHGDAAALYTEATASYPGDAELDLSEIKRAGVVASWGATSPWDEFYSGAGWKVSFGAELKADGPDGMTADWIVGNQKVTVSGRPKGITVAQALAQISGRFQGAAGVLGATSLNNGGDDLILTNADLYVCLYGASLNERQQLLAAPQEDAVGNLTWTSSRTITAGAVDPVALVAIEAPV